MTRYRSVARHSDHDYGEYISQINFVDAAERALEKADGSTLAQKLAEFFYDEYRDELPEKNTRRAAFQKAKSLVRRNWKIGRKLLPRFNGRQGYRKAIKEAIEMSHIRKIKLDVPWHPVIYQDPEKLTTLPHQHKSVVLYSERAPYEFYAGEYVRKGNYPSHLKPESTNKRTVANLEDLLNLKSVFKTGFIEPGGGHYEIDKKSDENKSMGERFAIYFSAGNYREFDRPVTIEAEIPINLLGFRGSRSTEVIRSVEDWFEAYDNPMERVMSGCYEVIFAKKYGEKGVPHLPLKFVNGIHHEKISSAKDFRQAHFYPVSQIAKALYERDPEKYPAPNEWNLQQMERDSLNYSFRRKSRGESLDLDKVRDHKRDFRLLESALFGFDQDAVQLANDIKSLENQSFEYADKSQLESEVLGVVEDVREFNQRVDRLFSFLKETSYSSEIEISKIQLSTALEKGYLQNVENVINKSIDEIKTAVKQIHESSETGKSEDAAEAKKTLESVVNNVLSQVRIISFDKAMLETLLIIAAQNTEINKDSLKEIEKRLIRELHA